MLDQDILQLDVGGIPQGWVDWQEAVIFHAKGMVAWSIGEEGMIVRGGTSRMTGQQSIIQTAPIIAVKGEKAKSAKYKTPTLSNRTLFRRDRHVCAYCGNIFVYDHLSREHIIPTSKGGHDTWMNVVSACKPCNHRKANRTPDAAGMTLLYLPYVPSKFEELILKNRRILQCQMDFLMNHVPPNSRLWS
jgi:hypothetical protein